MDDSYEEDEMKGEGTHMLGFSGLPKGKKLQDIELKIYMERFGEVKYCRIRRNHGWKGKCIGVADVLFQNIQGQTNALNSQHVYKDRHCTLSRDDFLKEKERIKQRLAKEKPQDKVVMVGRFPKGTTKSDIEKHLAGYEGVKEVFLSQRGKAFVTFDTPFNAVHFVQKKLILPGQSMKPPMHPQFFTGRGSEWRPLC